MILVAPGRSRSSTGIPYPFGAFLVFTASRWIATARNPTRGQPGAQVIRSHMKIAPGYDGEKFFHCAPGQRMATPLFVVIRSASSTSSSRWDLDPGDLRDHQDPFIVLTSNVFAIPRTAGDVLPAGRHATSGFHLLVMASPSCWCSSAPRCC